MLYSRVVLRFERATDNIRSNLTTLEKIMYTLLQKKLIIFPIKFLVPTHARRSHISVLDTRVVNHDAHSAKLGTGV